MQEAPSTVDWMKERLAKGTQLPSDREWAEYILQNIEHCRIVKDIILDIVGVEGESQQSRQEKLIQCIIAGRLRVIDFEHMEKKFENTNDELLALYKQELRRLCESKEERQLMTADLFWFHRFYVTANDHEDE